MFSSILYREQVDKLKIDYLLGHKIRSKQDLAYFQTKPEDLYKEYLKALPQLTLEKVKVERLTSPELEMMLDKHRKDREDLDYVLEKFEENEWLFEGFRKVPEIQELYKKAFKDNVIKSHKKKG